MSDPLEQAAIQALRANQALLLLTVLTMLEEAKDLDDAKARLNAVIHALTYEEEAAP